MRLLQLLVVGATVSLAGCSALLDFDCQSDDDCANLEGSFTCQEGACVGVTAATVCGGEPLLTTECTDIVGPLFNVDDSTTEERAQAYLDNPNDYVLVSVHPPNGELTGEAAGDIRTMVGVSVENINSTGGFADGRQLAVLFCVDGAQSPEAGVRAGLHAVDCGAKALIGTVEDDPTIRLYNEVAKVRDVPLIAPGAISPEIPTVRGIGRDSPQANLLTRIKVPGAVVANGTGEYVRNLDGHRRVRILVRENDPYSEGMHDELRVGMCQNSVFCAMTENSDVVTFRYSGATETDVRTEVAEFFAEAGQDDTDLVITIAPNLIDLLGMLGALGDWGGGSDVITIEGARSALAMSIYIGAVGGDLDAALRGACRALGISSGTVGPQRPAYDAKASRASLDGDFVPTPAYVDATFVTAYAIASSIARRSGVVDTLGITDGLQLISDKNATQVAVFNWRLGRDEIAAGNTIDYQGASGEIDLDGETFDVSDQKVEVWQYALGNGDRFDVRDVRKLDEDGDETSETESLLLENGSVDPAIPARLMRSLDPFSGNGPITSDPVCGPYPYFHLVPNPEVEMPEEG